MEIKTRPDIGRALVTGDNVLIDTGTDLVSASPDRFSIVGVRTITADATLAATDRLVIIDSADPTISITLDAGSATRAPVEILWPGHSTDTRILTLVRDGGTGTIDGASASRVVGVPSAGGISIRVWSADAHEWYTASGAMPSLMPLVTTSSDAIGVGDLGANVVYAAGTVNLTLPPGVLGRRVVILRGIYSTYGINVTPDGAETINAVGGATALPGAAYATVGTAWTLEYFYLEGIGPMWGLHSASGALSALRSPYTATDTSTVAGASATWDPQYTTLLTGYASGITTVTLDSTTGADWVPGKPLRLQVSNTGGFGIAIALASGTDTLNGQAAGVGYPLLPGSNAVPSASQMPPAYEVIYGGSGAWTIRPMVDFGPRLDDIESVLGPLSSTTVPGLATRVGALEVPSALACDGAGAVHTKSWTTEAEADVTDAVAAYTIGLDGDTIQWPIGVARPVNKLNTSANTITLDPQPTHTINGVAAGTNVLLMNSAAVPSGTAAAGIWRVKRLSATAWWVQ